MLPFTLSPEEHKLLLLASLEFTKKRLSQVGEFMKLHDFEELGVGAQEDYQILERKLKEVEEKVENVIHKDNEVSKGYDYGICDCSDRFYESEELYTKVKQKVEE
jgi:hypothetical protein